MKSVQNTSNMSLLPLDQDSTSSRKYWEKEAHPTFWVVRHTLNIRKLLDPESISMISVLSRVKLLSSLWAKILESCRLS